MTANILHIEFAKIKYVKSSKQWKLYWRWAKPTVRHYSFEEDCTTFGLTPKCFLKLAEKCAGLL
ncbi:DUF3024 domain-containing protein [Sphingobacterium puteale]|uniref:DUF3024 domain-containing protein n=1 Tax=Sphingobacterium puteale TaxID=2420510 RepID=A0A420W1P6_9SPHI|nr:DUF3024 domain-containing protein [Sphingobacterium puteale]